jgi:CRP/FNR family transcriptional regulator, cyclic AMP receptor protein
MSLFTTAATGTASRADQLAQVPLFAACNKKERQMLARLGRDVCAAAGEIVLRQGESSTDCFVIVSGSVSVEIDGTAVATLSPGESFGELAPLDRQPRSATVTTLEASTFFVFDDKAFAEAVATIPGLTKKVLASLSTRVRESNLAVSSGR